MTELAVWMGAAVAGALSVVAAVELLPAPFRRAPHVRSNYRGREVLGTAGVVLLAPLCIGGAAASLDGASRTEVSMLVGGAAMAALGLLDDLYGSRHAGGFAGHVRELLHGRVTTGLIKAIGGGVVGLVVAWATGWAGVWIVAAAAVVALSANLFNLLDVRPGRAAKVWLPSIAILVAFGVAGEAERILIALAGGVVVFGVHELRERVMLGDTGAGLLGVVAGVAAAVSLGELGLLLLLATLVGLTAAAEIVSFTRVIESIPPLRWADRLGRAR